LLRCLRFLKNLTSYANSFVPRKKKIKNSPSFVFVSFPPFTSTHTQEKFPEAEDFIGAFRIVVAVICGITAGVLGLEGIVPLAGSWAIASILGFVYSAYFLKVDATSEEGIPFVSIIGNNFFPVLSSLLLSWTIAYNVTKNPSWIEFEKYVPLPTKAQLEEAWSAQQQQQQGEALIPETA
jgi:hypothetical protein